MCNHAIQKLPQLFVHCACVDAIDQSDVIVSKCVPLTIKNTVSGALLLVSARSQGNEEYRFTQNVTIRVVSQDVTTFIETDKSIYKPSDTGEIKLALIYLLHYWSRVSITIP
jgi:hypothetical protein